MVDSLLVAGETQSAVSLRAELKHDLARNSHHAQHIQLDREEHAYYIVERDRDVLQLKRTVGRQTLDDPRSDRVSAAVSIGGIPALLQGIGFSHFVSLGNQLDVGFADILDFLAEDPRTTSAMLYIESIREGKAKRHIEWKAKSAVRRDVLEPLIRAAIVYDPTT